MFDISPVKETNPKKWSVVLNYGEKIKLPDGTSLGNFESGLFRDIRIEGEKLLAFELGNDFEVSNEAADFCRKNWTQAFDIFPHDVYKGADFYKSPEREIGDIVYYFWYCGEEFSCGIHNKHDFFELHTQILGEGEMQKFHENDENTVYSRDILSPGQTHQPFFDEKGLYGWHQYYSNTKCIWLAIESKSYIPIK